MPPPPSRDSSESHLHYPSFPTSFNIPIIQSHRLVLLLWLGAALCAYEPPHVAAAYGHCPGSCFGAAAFASGLQFLVLKCNLHIPTSPQYCAIPVACWRHASAAFDVAHVIEFLCFSFTKLMVLNRMIECAVIHETATSRWSHIVIRWFKFGFASSAASSCIANTDLANNL